MGYFPCIFCLRWGLTSQSTIFQSCRDGAIASWVINQYFRGVKCLAQGHNTGGGRFRTPDLSLRSPTLYHWATAPVPPPPLHLVLDFFLIIPRWPYTGFLSILERKTDWWLSCAFLFWDQGRGRGCKWKNFPLGSAANWDFSFGVRIRVEGGLIAWF